MILMEAILYTENMFPMKEKVDIDSDNDNDDNDDACSEEE